jgi:K+-transporting ATPase A subunit
MWAYKAFTSFSLAPLRVITVTGFAMVGILSAMLLFYLGSYLTGAPSPPGFMTLLCFIIAPFATVMLSLGIIGEYLGRLFVEVKNRPLQVISILVNDHRQEPIKWLGRYNRKGVCPPSAEGVESHGEGR